MQFVSVGKIIVHCSDIYTKIKKMYLFFSPLDGTTYKQQQPQENQCKKVPQDITRRMFSTLCLHTVIKAKAAEKYKWLLIMTKAGRGTLCMCVCLCVLSGLSRRWSSES